VERAMQEMNEKDRDSARAALEQAQLPEGVKPTDVVKYRAHNIIKEERQKLSNLIEQYRDENNELEKLVRDARAKVESEIVKIEEVSKELDRTADVCATLS
jgi:predicted  nucleic acid-binding Zn-ribbon protein